MTAQDNTDAVTPAPDAAAEVAASEAAAAEVKRKHDHDDDMADEWGRESFPASDPPEY